MTTEFDIITDKLNMLDEIPTLRYHSIYNKENPYYIVPSYTINKMSSVYNEISELKYVHSRCFAFFLLEKWETFHGQ
jgi:hypothetical protein